MSGFQTPITIVEALKNIGANRYLLPAFQREYVWNQYQVVVLFDSLMRGYPISSMLFWKVSGTAKNQWKFYKFLDNYVERFQVHNDVFDTSVSEDFFAILDGQQRLTSINIALRGTYAYHEYYKPYQNTPTSYPPRTLYFRLKENSATEGDPRIYIFSFLKNSETKKENFFRDSDGCGWFRTGYILSLHSQILNFVIENRLNQDEMNLLTKLENMVFNLPLINFYQEDDSSPDQAVNIFTRINAGGSRLSFSDILFSLMIANWEKRDARTEIHNVVDNLNNTKGFSISKDFVLKVFLFLYCKSIKNEIKNFDKSFCGTIEKNWDNIRDCIYSLFDLLKTFGLDSQSLTSLNATLPIIYYMYHKKIYVDFASKTQYKSNREQIKKWLLTVLLKKAFRSSSNSILMKTRKAFTEDISKGFISSMVTDFPAKDIISKMELVSFDDEAILGLLENTQKDSPMSFSILSLLYPHLDYKNNNFHKDHLHPVASYESLSDNNKAKYPFPIYNSILNLQMLDANENESKKDKPLNSWIEKATTAENRKQFLDSHLIPDVDLSIEKFEEFIENRKILLVGKLKTLIN